ncbi:hypothetical protein ACWD4L_41135 [Streptomyces sp. NPDC002596]
MTGIPQLSGRGVGGEDGGDPDEGFLRGLVRLEEEFRGLGPDTGIDDHLEHIRTWVSTPDFFTGALPEPFEVIRVLQRAKQAAENLAAVRLGGATAPARLLQPWYSRPELTADKRATLP